MLGTYYPCSRAVNAVNSDSVYRSPVFIVFTVQVLFKSYVHWVFLVRRSGWTSHRGGKGDNESLRIWSGATLANANYFPIFSKNTAQNSQKRHFKRKIHFFFRGEGVRGLPVPKPSWCTPPFAFNQAILDLLLHPKVYAYDHIVDHNLR